mgnify:CR=1 FL=1
MSLPLEKKLPVLSKALMSVTLQNEMKESSRTSFPHRSFMDNKSLSGNSDSKFTITLLTFLNTKYQGCGGAC